MTNSLIDSTCCVPAAMDQPYMVDRYINAVRCGPGVDRHPFADVGRFCRAEETVGPQWAAKPLTPFFRNLNVFGLNCTI